MVVFVLRPNFRSISFRIVQKCILAATLENGKNVTSPKKLDNYIDH